MIKRQSRRLATRSLPESLPDQCLLRLVIGAAPSAEHVAAPPENIFSVEDGLRHIVFEGKQANLRDSAGLRQLAYLLQAPGREFDVRALMAQVRDPSDIRLSFSDLDAQDLTLEHWSTQEVATREDLKIVDKELEKRLKELAEAEESGDDVRAKDLEKEIQQLRDYKRKAQGLGRRVRTFTTDDERARKAVSMNISRALKKLQRVHPVFARHVEQALVLGMSCSYRPVSPIDWSI
jgi:hypothetical protein